METPWTLSGPSPKMGYGSLEVPPGGRERRRNGAIAVGAALLCAALLALAAVGHQGHRSVLLGKKQPQAWSYDWSGESVPVPREHYNYRAGTTVLPRTEFENPAMDKARAMQLAEKQPKQLWAYDWAGESVPVPREHYNYRAGTTVVPRTEFENPAMDRARPTQLAAARRAAGLSTLNADRQMNAYFASMAHAAERKRALPPSDFTARAADKDVAAYFAAQARTAQLTPKTQLAAAHPTKKHAALPEHVGESGAQATREMANYWKSQAAAAATPQHPTEHMRVAVHHVQNEKGPKFGMSTQSADSDIDGYFAAEQARAKATQKAAKPHKEEAAPKGKAPKYGWSAWAADKDVNSYFKKQQKLAKLSETHHKVGSETHAEGEVECVGKVCADKTLDRPLWLKKNNLLPDNLVPADKADCTEDIDCESAHSAFVFKSKKGHQLSAYGYGAEHDNAIKLGKAVGVDDTQPVSVIEKNTPPSEETMIEVNDAINSQRSDRYTNGNGMPVEKISMPERTQQ